MATKKEKKEQEKKETAKAQINATTAKSGSMSGAYTEAGFDDLVAGTRSGKKGALAERLRRSGHGPA